MGPVTISVENSPRMIGQSQRSVGRKGSLQQFEVMPLRRRRGDQREVIVVMAQHRHLGHDPAPVVGEIGQVHPAHLGQPARDPAAQPVGGPGAVQVEAGETGQVQNAHIVADVQAFLADARLPRPVPVPGLRLFLRGVVAGLGEPVRPFPAVIGPEDRTHRPEFGMQGRFLLAAPGGPFVIGEVHGVFVAIDLHPLGVAVILVAIRRSSGAGRRTTCPIRCCPRSPIRPAPCPRRPPGRCRR